MFTVTKLKVKLVTVARVRNSLKLNGYTDRFIDKACEPKPDATPLADSSSQRATFILPYVQGVSDRLRRTLRAYNVGTIIIIKTTTNPGHSFQKTKGPSGRKTGPWNRIQSQVP